MNKILKENPWFWFIPSFLALVQILFTLQAINQLRFEELIDSVNGVYWLGNGHVCGIYTTIGWSWILLIFYEIFGFTITSAKFVRLAIEILALFSLAYLLKKYLNPKLAILPLLTIGLSPTLIFFTTTQNSQAFDINTIPIVLFLIDILNFKKKFFSIIIQIILGVVVMIGCMAYGGFVFYIPILFYLYLLKLFKFSKKKSLRISNLLLLALAFLIPLIIAFIFIKDKENLVLNPVTKTGLFRGYGKFSLDTNDILTSLDLLTTDLFSHGSSYFFEVRKVEFSDFYPIISICFILIFSIRILIKYKKYRKILIPLYLTIIFGSVFANLVGPHGGVRRGIIILASFYALFTICWLVFNQRKTNSLILNTIIFVIFYLILIHHITALVPNYNALKIKSPFTEKVWFNKTTNPQDSLNLYIKQITEKDFLIECRDQKNQASNCDRGSMNFPNLYHSIKGYCKWNNLQCHDIKTFNPKTKSFEKLSYEDCGGYKTYSL